MDPLHLKNLVALSERTLIARALIDNGHNRTHTAIQIGISRRTLLNKINKYGLKSRALVLRAAGSETPEESELTQEQLDAIVAEKA